MFQSEAKAPQTRMAHMDGFLMAAGAGEVSIECSAASFEVATSGGGGGMNPTSVANTRLVVERGASEGMCRSSHQLQDLGDGI